GRIPDPMPERVSAWAVYDVFETADNNQIFVGVVTDSQWRSFCEVFGFNNLIAGEYDTNVQRVAARNILMPGLRRALLDLSLAEIETRCAEAGVPFAPIKRPDELLSDPHMLA